MKTTILTLEEVKQKLNENIGNRVLIKHNLGRNKIEKYHVIIKELYNYVFTVETDETSNKELKSFSYTDIITKTIKIDY
ncbi:MAG: Veg family protein [Bacilli bacterium]|nr:Veg family protein [Bacilli bacterium]